MCGVAGIAGLTDVETGRLKVEQMVGALARRGPDAEGFARLPGVVLGHRRLAIFDLSDAGAQPMSSADRTLWVVFNGAIYNFKSLRAELEKLGCRFRGDSDTEVLLHGYRAWGIDCLVRRLRGMFAFGLWDNPGGRLYLVRDRLGVKPLVFASDGNEIAFASTVRALKASGYGGEINDHALLDLLRWGFVTEEQCIYDHIRKLPAATILEWSAGKYGLRRYWEAPRPKPAPRMTFHDAIAEVEQRLREAVAIRLAADVPVAVLLSGGIDSSLVCWAVAELGADVTAYTVGIPGDPWDESAAAVRTARRLGIRHRVLAFGDGQMPDLDELLSAYDEPFPSSSALGMLRIARAVGAAAKVVLTGDGGDDLFLGYPRHRHLWLAQGLGHLIAPSFAETWNRWGRPALPPGPLRRAGALLDYATGGVDAFVAKCAGLAGYRAKGLLGTRFKEHIDDSFRNGVEQPDGMVQRLVDFEREGRFVAEYLKKVDGATMHYGIEARAPFLDQELWSFAGALPVNLRLHYGELKAILRALARRHMGVAISTRKKRGFRIPAHRWLANHWFERGEQAFNDSILARQGWIDGRNAMAALRRAAQDGSAGEELWNLFVIESWLQQERHERRNHAGALRDRPAALVAHGVSCQP
jgi:asparagine synthase (glutamine-hydrolysing)